MRGFKSPRPASIHQFRKGSLYSTARYGIDGMDDGMLMFLSGKLQMQMEGSVDAIFSINKASDTICKASAADANKIGAQQVTTLPLFKTVDAASRSSGRLVTPFPSQDPVNLLRPGARAARRLHHDSRDLSTLQILPALHWQESSHKGHQGELMKRLSRLRINT
jgi:hypothetical protein